MEEGKLKKEIINALKELKQALAEARKRERARIFFVGKYLGRGKVEVEDSRAGIVDAKIKKGIKVKKGI
jgi:hypothetical protein